MKDACKFKRKNIFLVNPVLNVLKEQIENVTLSKIEPLKSNKNNDISPECYVLVINSSQEMAKEITLQLSLSMPGCSIIYAPSIQLASLIIKRRSIDLIVSSPLLPDGPVSNLRSVLDDLDTPPDLIVVGDSTSKYSELLKDSRYNYITQRKVNNTKINEVVKSLGADIRNDLNNPLQEIVAMVFIARNGKATSNTKQALDAIDKAAINMASIVNSLEEKIRAKVCE